MPDAELFSVSVEAVSEEEDSSVVSERLLKPPILNWPMASTSIMEASTRAEESSRCPASVDGMVPSSCPSILSARSMTVSYSICAAVSYSS